MAQQSQQVVDYSTISNDNIVEIEADIKEVQDEVVGRQSEINELLTQVRLKEARTFENGIELGGCLLEWQTEFAKEAGLPIKGNRATPKVANALKVVHSQIKERFGIGESYCKTFITWHKEFGKAITDGTFTDEQAMSYIEEKQSKSIDRLPLHPDTKKKLKARIEKDTPKTAPPKSKGNGTAKTVEPETEKEETMQQATPLAQAEFGIHEAEEQLNDAVKLIKKHKLNISSPAIMRVVTGIRNHIKYLEKKL